MIAPASPAFVEAFLQREKILEPSRVDTIVHFTAWATQLVHDFRSKAFLEAGLQRESAAFLAAFWGERAFPSVFRVLTGTQQSVDPTHLPETRYWTAGCWRTTGLFKAVLRVNGLVSGGADRRAKHNDTGIRVFQFMGASANKFNAHRSRWEAPDSEKTGGYERQARKARKVRGFVLLQPARQEARP